MGGGIVRYKKYFCPHCKMALSNASIVIANQTSKCPFCKETLNIKFINVLDDSKETVLGKLFLFAIYLAILWATVVLFNIDLKRLTFNSPYIFFILCAITLAIGFALIEKIFKFEQQQLIKAIAKNIEDGEI